MKSVIPILRKYLTKEVFEKDGFLYYFIEVKGVDDDSAMYITVNTKLPNPKQSFVVEKFRTDITKIIGNLSTYLGTPFPYYLNVLVDGVETNEIYIKPEDQKEILLQLKSHFEYLDLPIGKFEVLDIIPNENFYAYYDSQDIIEFEMEFKLKPKGSQKQIDDIEPYQIPPLILENHWADFENIYYDVLNPEFKIGGDDYEIYFETKISVSL